jgi:nitrite reductase/ring-hydroxylating ferredoxin subunit
MMRGADVTTDHAGASGSKSYSGYYNRPAPAEPQPLTETGPGTPGGEYLRRFWHPFLMSEELGDTPKLVRLLGEELVLFRDGSGRLGLLHKPCVHRGTSLEYGIPAERGIRCCYHGWLFDVDGTILETPAEPASSRIHVNFCQGAYPVREHHGLIFAYMGPPELTPEFPLYDCFTYPSNNRLVPFSLSMPCNWVQIVENASDPIHNVFLHVIVSGAQFAPHFAVPPALEFVDTPLGFLCSAVRRVKDSVFIRAGEIIMPNVAQFIGGGAMRDEDELAIAGFLTRWATPLDDGNSLYIGYIHFNDVNGQTSHVDEDKIGLGRLNLIGQTADRPYVERQREPGDYDAVGSQGAVANRKAEHLGTTDRGVVLFRRLRMRGIKAIADGETPALPRIYPEGPVRSYAHTMTMQAPPGAKLGQGETKLLGEFGRRVAKIVVETDNLPPEERERAAKQRVRELLDATAEVAEATA